MPGLRPVGMWEAVIRQEERPDGTILVWQEGALDPVPRCLSDRIAHWAQVAPERVWMAERDGVGGWREVTYGELAGLQARIGAGLLDLGLSVERPLLILSGNGIDHALMALGAQHVGIPSAAIAPAYSLSGGGVPKLRDILGQITPGAIFADDIAPFAPAIEEVVEARLPLIAARGGMRGREVIRLSDLAAATPGETARRAAEAVGPDTVAKFLFTSGTTGSPKAVIQTQRMLCTNMEQVRDCYAFLKDEPPVLVDWPPWNHVASGNKAFNMALYNGGTFHVDRGRPTPEGIAETIRNLREIAPTWYFNVPVGYEALVAAMEDDPALARNFFGRLRLMMYAGAGMASHTWKALRALSERTVGARTLMATALGATETAPFALFCSEEQEEPGNVGVPAKGVTLKLVPLEGKLELRIRGDNVTPGYWRNAELTEAAFDEEGFYRMGDALRYAVPGEPAKGFLFDGRIAENFKLDTGTWVAVGAVRAGLVDAMGGLVRDAVIAGEGRAELGALLVPARAAAEALVEGGGAMDDATLWAQPAVRAALAERLTAHAAAASGSSMRVARVLVLTEPLDLNAGEVTDKGSVNQRAVLSRRADLVEALFGGGPEVIRAGLTARA